MRIAMFVEGSAPLGSKDHCARLWNTTLFPALGCAAVDLVIPIGKDAITNMLGLHGSSSAPALDALICQRRTRHGLDPDRDALIIAWDLEPIDEGRTRCALDELIDVYRALGCSTLLQDTAWSRSAANQVTRLEPRRGMRPPTGLNHARVVPGSVVAVCMNPMFDVLLTRDGKALRRTLDLAQDPPGWPTGWGWPTGTKLSGEQRDPSGKLMAPAITAVRRIRPKHKVRRQIRETWENAKDEWSEYFLRKLLADPAQAEHIIDHPILRRLKAILPPGILSVDID